MPAIWLIRLVKLTAVKKFVAVSPKRMTTRISPTMIGAGPRLPVLRLNEGPVVQAGEAARELLRLGRLRAVGADDVDGRHSSPPTAGAARTMPETLVGTPTVIASTMVCCVVVWRS